MSGIPIQIDPFFDGSDDPSLVSPRQQSNRGLSTYRDASSETFEVTDPRGLPTSGVLAGRPVTAVLRPQVRGMNMGGTIVPPATVGGTPEGFNPNILDDVEVVIDPHIAGQRTRLRVGDLTAEAVSYGQQVADQAVPNAAAPGLRRFKAAAAYHGMAQYMGGTVSRLVETEEDIVDEGTAVEQAQPVKRASPPRVTVTNGHQVSAARPTAQPSARSSASPMSLLRKPPAQPAVLVSSQREEPVQRALVRVNFEIDLALADGKRHNHSWSAKYHDVDISTSDESGKPYAISFLWDNTAEDEPYVPPAGDDDGPEIAMEIVGRPEVYLVRALPFQYKSLLAGRYRQIQFLVLRFASTEG